MRNTKINVDRRPLSAGEILETRNFDQVLSRYRFMRKPFYQYSWFYGPVGVASLGLLLGGVLSLQSNRMSAQVEPMYLSISDYYIPTKIPPNKAPLSSLDSKPDKATLVLPSPKTAFEGSKAEIKKKETEKIVDDKIITTELVEKKIESKPEAVISQEAKAIVDENKAFDRMDLHPRIAGKINGSIARKLLFHKEGLVTNTEVEIVSFELHVVNNGGGQVFLQKEGNHLTKEMHQVLRTVGPGETIYFEKIIGRSKEGMDVKLNPLRYELLN